MEYFMDYDASQRIGACRGDIREKVLTEMNVLLVLTILAASRPSSQFVAIDNATTRVAVDNEIDVVFQQGLANKSPWIGTSSIAVAPEARQGVGGGTVSISAVSDTGSWNVRDVRYDKIKRILDFTDI
jgi:hypothetical protein